MWKEIKKFSKNGFLLVGSCVFGRFFCHGGSILITANNHVSISVLEPLIGDDSQV